MKFTNYRPVRSMFAKDSKPDDPSERDWSVETMCFGDHGDPGTEECANWACGSGARWCHQRSGDDIKQHLDWDAPWQQLPIRGTSDGTFRNNFWQSALLSCPAPRPSPPALTVPVLVSIVQACAGSTPLRPAPSLARRRRPA